MNKKNVEINMQTYVTALCDMKADEICKTIIHLKKIRKQGGSVFVCGNGGSAGNASHFASDLLLTSGIKATCLNDNPSVYSALINDVGWNNVYQEQLKIHAEKGDCLIVLSVHGGVGKQDAGDWSLNLNNAIDYAKKLGMSTIGISGATGGYFNICDMNIIVESTSTPIVEGIHCALAHLIAFLLVRDEL